MCVIIIVSECFSRITSPLTPTFFGPLPQSNSSVSVYLDDNYVMTFSMKTSEQSEPPSSKILVAYQFRVPFSSEEVRHALRNAQHFFCHHAQYKKGTLSQHFVTHVVPPLHSHIFDKV